MKFTARPRDVLANCSISLSIASGGGALVVYNYNLRIDDMVWVVIFFFAGLIAVLLAVSAIAYCLFTKNAMSARVGLTVILAVVSVAISKYVAEDYFWGFATMFSGG